MKKLVTVTWSRTIQVDLPEDTKWDTINKDTEKALVAQAFNELHEQDGDITDIQDAE